MRQDLSAGQRIMRSLGLTVMTITALTCGSLAYAYATGDYAGGWRQALVVLSLVAGAAAGVAMTVDAFDLWMLDRRFSPFSVRMLHSLVFVAMLTAIVLSLVSRTSGFLLIMAPALIIYLFTAVRPPQAVPRPGSGAGQRRGTSGAGAARPQASRQRRGGRKRK